MTAAPKKPQDHQPKSDKKSAIYELKFDGEVYPSKDVHTAITPAFMRANRRRDEVDAFFTMIEELWSRDVLEKTVDKMDNDQFSEFMKDFYGWMDVQRGESSAS
jgi:hypothetical protein